MAGMSNASKKPNSSVVVGRGMQKAGKSDAFVSAGNTGAYLAIAMFRLRTMEGVHRPALATRWPTMKGGYTVMLDVGANVQADAEQLVEFAIMGEAFSRAVFAIYVRHTERMKFADNFLTTRWCR